MIPIIPLTSDTPRLHQHGSPFSGMAPHKGTFHQSVPPSGTVPRKRAFHQGRANPQGAGEASNHASSLQNERFVRFKSAKRAFRTRPSVSYATSSKSHASHASSLQDEHFARDFLQKSHVKSPKQAFRTRLPQKLTCQSLRNKRFVRDCQAETPIRAHTSSSPAKQFRDSRTPARTPVPMSQRQSPLAQLTTSRFPAPATKVSASTRLTRAKYCACHEMSHLSHLASRFPAPATKIALPHLKAPHKVRLRRKVAISYHVSFNKICTTPHVWHDFDPF